MFDAVTLSLLWILTSGTSVIMYLLGRWRGGIYWFWLWNTITAIVAGWEAFAFFHVPVWALLAVITVIAFICDRWLPRTERPITMTRMITKSGTGEPLAMATTLEARGVVISYLLGATSLCTHLWVWK